MKLSQLGEFGLIDLLKKEFSRKNKSVVLGIGDDCAALNPFLFSPLLRGRCSPKPEGRRRTEGVKRQNLLLITTDTLVENVHFRITKGFPFEKLGQKALAVNISDIAAMGGVPTYAVISLAAPAKFKVENLLKIAKGISKLAKKCGVSIVGGDTVRSPKELMITITLLGEVERKYLLTRSGAKVGDAIMVTGEFGGPAAEKFCARGASAFGGDIRLKEGQLIAKSGLATAMIDSSDGLVRSLQEVCKASRVGARIFEGQVPRAKGASLKDALYGGEEYELVFTGAKELAKRVGATVIGEIISQKQGIVLVDSQGKVVKAEEGFQHFK